MFRKLHLQLTLFCFLVITIILISMTAITLCLIRNNEILKYTRDFQDLMSEVCHELTHQNSISHSWLEEIMSKNNLQISILDNGVPILYDATPDNAKANSLFSQARETALNDYALSDLSVKGKTYPEHKEFQMRVKAHDTYLASVAYIPTDFTTLTVTVIYALTPQMGYLNGLYLPIVLSAIFVILLLSTCSFFLIRYMIHPLVEGHKRQVTFITDASHELRSPLAVMISALSAMENATTERVLEFHHIAQKEALRMQRLVNDMFTLSALDNGSISIHCENVFLEYLFLDTYEKFLQPAHIKEIFMEISLPEEPLPQAICDPERISQVLTILFDNAISYTPKGGHVLTGISYKHNQFIISIADNGPGIPDEAKKEVFCRFYRYDKSRTDKNHFGLGLSIAQRIVVLHGGTISVIDSAEGGAEFIVMLPILQR